MRESSMGRTSVEAIKIAEEAFVSLDFKYSKQIVAALLPMGLTVILHGAGIELADRSRVLARGVRSPSALVRARAAVVEHLEPGNWWVGMRHPELQLLIEGPGVAALKPRLRQPDRVRRNFL